MAGKEGNRDQRTPVTATQPLAGHSDEPPTREVSSDQLPDFLIKGHPPERKLLFIDWVLQSDEFHDHIIHIDLNKAAERVGCELDTALETLKWCERLHLIELVSSAYSFYEVRWSFKRTKEENIRLYKTSPRRMNLGRVLPLIKSLPEVMLWNRLFQLWPFVFKEVPAAAFIDFDSIKNELNSDEQSRFFTLRYDFVCCNEHTLPVEVWEYNGTQHFMEPDEPELKAEDRIKQDLKWKYCNLAGLPFYRVDGPGTLQAVLEDLDDKLKLGSAEADKSQPNT